MRFTVFSKRSSTLALALALGMGGVLSVTALEAPAAAQKKKKDGDEAAKPQYSKAFIAAYNPVQTQFDQGTDIAAVKAALPGMIAAVENNDDRFVAGNFTYSVGTKASDRFAIPLCSGHHRRQHMRGWMTFEAECLGGKSAVAMADAYWTAWPGRIEWEREHG